MLKKLDRFTQTLARWITFWGMIWLGYTSLDLAEQNRFPEATYRLLWAYILHVVRQHERARVLEEKSKHQSC